MAGSGYEDAGDAVIEMDMLPPRWADIQDEVTDLLREIATESAELDRLHAKHVLPGFDDDHVKRNEEVAIERRTQAITEKFHACQRAIQRIEAMVREGKRNGSVSIGEETMAKNIQISLASRVQESSASFRKKQSNYLRSISISNPHNSRADTARTPPARRPWHRDLRILLHEPNSVHRPLDARVRDGQIIRAEHTAASGAEEVSGKRSSDRAARARHQRHRARDHRTGRYLQGLADHGD